ncbi:hypothetical protein LTR95_011891 [Oleoguttula sp. CCFEE 5521]
MAKETNTQVANVREQRARHRKRKCDGRKPCATCVRYEYQCEYTASGKRASLVHMTSDNAPETLPRQQSWPEVQPSVVQLQAHPLSAPGARFHHRGILDPVKTRFVRANSAIAFPRILGMDMEAESIPRLHSFAWNLGLRTEEQDLPVDVNSIIPYGEFQRLSAVYFSTVKRELGLLEEADFGEKSTARYANTQGYNELDLIILMVAALGSFFSSNPHPREADCIQIVKSILITKRMAVNPSYQIVAAWILLTIYLRCTGRPHGSWVASSMALHQAEASGLHKEMQTIAVVYPAASAADHKLVKTRRKLFWIARALNIVLSFEYGRSRVIFDVVTTKKFAPDGVGFAHQYVELADILPSDFVDREREPDPPAALGATLTRIEEIQTESHFITILKADLAFAIYRRLWLMSLTDAKDRAESILNIGKAALIAAEALLETRTPWWNVLHAPFMFVCVTLAVGTPRSFSYVAEAMTLLDKIAEAYPTHMVLEARNQAVAMVRMFRQRKEKELEALSALPATSPPADAPTVGSGMSQNPCLTDLDWTLGLESFQWDTFLNPQLVMSSQQQGGFANNLGPNDALGF